MEMQTEECRMQKEKPADGGTAQPRFEHWALVELFGHQRIVGKVSEQVIAGGAFLRVDVPASDRASEFTRFYGAAAIYSLSPIPEALARQMAAKQDAAPVSEYTIKQLAAADAREAAYDSRPDEEEDEYDHYDYEEN